MYLYSIFLKILSNVLGQHWLVKLCELQVHSSLTHHLCIVLCAPARVKSPPISIHPPHPLLPPPLPSPSGNHRTVVCVYQLHLLFCLIPFPFFVQPPNHPPLRQLSVGFLSMSLFLFCLLVYFAHQIPHLSEIISYGICLSLTALFNSA